MSDGRALELLPRDEVLGDLPAAPASAFDADAAAGRQMLGHLGW
ncbi:hypothetical protein [Kutzneria kofuensis]